MASTIPEIVFQPKYTLKLTLLLLMLFALVPVLAIIAWSSRELSPVLMLVGIAILNIVLGHIWIRRIEFYSQEFAVVPLVGFKKLIAYADIQDVGIAIKTRRGNIGLFDMRNSDALVELLMNRIQPGQLSGKMLRAQSNLMRAVLFSLPGLPVVWFILDYLGVSGKHFSQLVLAVWGVLVVVIGLIVERLQKKSIT